MELGLRALVVHFGNGSIEAAMAKFILAQGFGSADSVYSVTTADHPVLEEAKRRGMTVCHEQFIAPDYPEVLREEAKRFPSIARICPERASPKFAEEHIRQWGIADQIIVPSNYVAETCKERGANPSKIRLVPYGIPGRLAEAKSSPRRGRVLFIGTVGLRKGLVYLSEAARILQQRGLRYDLRVVGHVPAATRNERLFAGLHFIGRIPRSEIAKEYQAADIFVIPSLCEGSATVHLEALAFGLPVIATPAAGTVVTDKVDGFLVPPRNGSALADKIEQLVEDRKLREKMSAAAKTTVQQYTWERYGQRLIEALSS
jgi:glycosyltransferase involved in cell wall biosynthesis